jgi:hypothetical protein
VFFFDGVRSVTLTVWLVMSVTLPPSPSTPVVARSPTAVFASARQLFATPSPARQERHRVVSITSPPLAAWHARPDGGVDSVPGSPYFSSAAGQRFSPPWAADVTASDARRHHFGFGAEEQAGSPWQRECRSAIAVGVGVAVFVALGVAYYVVLSAR